MWGVLGLAIIVATGFAWFRLINAVAIPRNRSAFLMAFGAGAVLGIFSIIQGSSWLGSVSGGIAAVLGTMFLFLRAQSAQKPNTPAVAVGDRMLAFSAPDENGEDFDLSVLRGKPYLLKFFRGHW